jgi:hypothetical protein
MPEPLACYLAPPESDHADVAAVNPIAIESDPTDLQKLDAQQLAADPFAAEPLEVEPADQPTGPSSDDLAAGEETSSSVPVPTEPADPHRSDWIERIRSERRLPAALRDRLAAAVVEAGVSVDGDEPRLTVSQVAQVFAEAVPALLAIDRPASAAVHPAGESFFQGGELSDSDAARLAREQLSRTGFGGE